MPIKKLTPRKTGPIKPIHPDGGVMDDPMFTPDPKKPVDALQLVINDAKARIAKRTGGVMGVERCPHGFAVVNGIASVCDKCPAVENGQGTLALRPEDDTAPLAGKTDLAAIVAIGQGLRNLEARIEAGETLLKTLKEKHHRITTEELPAMMEQLGVTEFKLATGEKVVVTPVTSASIPSESAIEKTKEEDKRQELRTRYLGAMAWLKEVGADSIIKTFVKCELGKDSDKLAEKVTAALRKLGVEATVGRGVHPQTLTAWVRERLQAGLAVDFDLLAVYTGHKAEIKQPGKRK